MGEGCRYQLNRLMKIAIVKRKGSGLTQDDPYQADTSAKYKYAIVGPHVPIAVIILDATEVKNLDKRDIVFDIRMGNKRFSELPPHVWSKVAAFFVRAGFNPKMTKGYSIKGLLKKILDVIHGYPSGINLEEM